MPQKSIAYAGTYTLPFSYVPDSNGKGIHQFELDLATGYLTNTEKIYALDNPSFVTIDPSQKYLYACTEVDDGIITAFSIDAATGDLQRLNQQSAGGRTTAYVSVGRQSCAVLAAN